MFPESFAKQKLVMRLLTYKIGASLNVEEAFK